MSEQFTSDVRFAFRRAFTWWETYLAFGMGLLLASAFVSGAVKDAMLKQSLREFQDVKVQTERANKDTAKIMSDIAILHDQNVKSMNDRASLNEDRVRVDTRLELAEKNQANIQKALENAQRSFNDARSILLRMEATGKVKP